MPASPWNTLGPLAALSLLIPLRDALVADGHVQGADLFYYVASGAGHTEAAWAARLHLPLTYLFPWQGTAY